MLKWMQPSVVTPIYSLLLEGGTYVGLANNILTASGGVTLTGGQVYSV